MLNIDPLYIQAALFAIVGGGVFSFCLDNLLPLFDVAPLSSKQVLIGMEALAILFWGTWLMPMGVLLLLLDRPVWIVVTLTILFFLFNISGLLTVGVLGRIRSWRERRRKE